MNTAALLRHLDAPPLANRTGICAAAVVADVDALATEWSRGNALSMISDGTAAQRNAEAVIIEAAVRILSRAPLQSMTTYERGMPVTTRSAERAMADLLQAFQVEDASAVEFYADEVARWFREGV